MITFPKSLIVGSSKTYTHAQGLSCCFRQWRAKSHCQFLHGYALQVKIEFEAKQLDDRNWVVDFGAMKSFKSWLESQFDHKTLVATDDPMLDTYKALDAKGLIQMEIVEAVGCEAFALLIFQKAEEWVWNQFRTDRIHVQKVTVQEHETNGAFVEAKRNFVHEGT